MNDGWRFGEIFFTSANQQGHFIDGALALDIIAAENQWLFTIGQRLAGNDLVGDLAGLVGGHADGHGPVKIRQRIGQRSGDATMLTGKLHALIGQRVQVVQAIQAGSEPGFIAFQNDGAFTVALAKNNPGRRLAYGVFNQPGGNPHPVTVHLCAGAVQKFQTARMGHFNTGPLQDFEGGHMNLFDLILIDNL